MQDKVSAACGTYPSFDKGTFAIANWGMGGASATMRTGEVGPISPAGPEYLQSTVHYIPHGRAEWGVLHIMMHAC